MNNKAFSLIELLVSVAILAIIVMIMSAVFHSSSIAWDSGLRKAHGNMTARAIFGLMSRDIQQAVADKELKAFLQDGVSSIAFTILDPEESTNRAARRVTYKKFKRNLIRKEQTCRNSSYGSWSKGTEVNLVTNLTYLIFKTPQHETYTTNLPEWVGITLGVKRADDVSRVSARSAGPDGIMGTGDDITGW